MDHPADRQWMDGESEGFAATNEQVEHGVQEEVGEVWDGVDGGGVVSDSCCANLKEKKLDL